MFKRVSFRRNKLLSILPSQPTLCLAFCCLFVYLLNHAIQFKSQNPNQKAAFYLEIAKPNDFPVVLRLSSSQELKRFKLLDPKIKNGDKIILNDNKTTSLSRINGEKSLALGIPIGINSASIEDLMVLPGIGNKLAEKIVEYRNLNNGFKSIDELDNVNGIGRKKIEFIRPFISLD
jgi:competence ComEA-like helix-hairpin-helix protein